MEVLARKYNELLNCKAPEESYLHGKDNVLLHTVRWHSARKPKSIILLLHDLGEHIMRYQQWAHFFNSKNTEVIGLDLHGHGKSDGKKGGTTYESLLNNVDDLVKYCETNFPNIQKILYGQGMGGNLALSYTIKNKAKISGIVASSPWLRLNSSSSQFMPQPKKIIYKLFPYFPAKFNLNYFNLTHDSSIISNYIADPLVHNIASPLLVDALNHAGHHILHNKHKINVPLLLMHGSEDKITSWRASATFAKNTSPNTTFKLWEGAFHELHSEFEKENIFEFIMKWLAQCHVKN